MRDIGEGTIRRIDWQELTPVVLFARVFSATWNFRVLFFSMFGVVSTLLAGYMINGVFLMAKINEERGIEDGSVIPRATVLAASHRMDDLYATPVYVEPLIDFRAKQTASFREDPIGFAWRLTQRSVLVPWDVFSASGLRLFSLTPMSWTERGVAFGWVVYLLAVWSLVGGLICRSAGLRFTLDQGDSFSNLLRFAKKRGTGYLSSMLFLSLGLCFFLVLIKIFGWVYSLPYVDGPMAFLFPISLLFGFLFMVLAVGLFFGWPLMFAAVSVEGTDGFDAISRMFSYVYQRPFHYLFYLLVGGVVGVIWFVLISLFIDGMVYLAIHVGGLPPKVVIGSLGDLTLPRLSDDLTFPESVVLCWCAMAQLLKIAFVFAWFWSSSTATYLLLRRSVDGTPYDEIFRFGENAADPRKLPEVRSDEKGAPEIV